MMRPRPAVIVLILSGMALIATPVAIAVAGPQPAVAPVVSIGERHATAAVPDPVTSPSAVVGRAPAISVVQIERASLAYPPVQVRIPAIDVDAPVIPVGLDDQRAVQIPEDIGTVGWYSLGVAPGSPVGSAVLVGHRDGRIDGRGALYDLARLVPGNRIAVTDSLGRPMLFEVVAREVVAKSVLPTDDLFAVDGPARLTIITCGGVYERDNGGYQANVIITAVPVPS